MKGASDSACACVSLASLCVRPDSRLSVHWRARNPRRAVTARRTCASAPAPVHWCTGVQARRHFAWHTVCSAHCAHCTVCSVHTISTALTVFTSRTVRTVHSLAHTLSLFLRHRQRMPVRRSGGQEAGLSLTSPTCGLLSSGRQSLALVRIFCSNWGAQMGSHWGASARREWAFPRVAPLQWLHFHLGAQLCGLSVCIQSQQVAAAAEIPTTP